MNNRTRHFGTSVGLSAAALFLAAGAAFGADVPLATLNGGPSSAEVPVAAGDRVATFAYPREIVNIDVPFVSVDPLTDATDVEDANDPNVGLRNRSRAIVPGSAGFNGAAGTFVVAQVDFANGASAADSYILFLNTASAAGIDTVAELQMFITNGAAGVDFIQISLDNAALDGGTGFADAELLTGDLDDGIFIEAAELAAANANYDTFELAIVVFVDEAGAEPPVATEFACVDGDGNDITITAAVLDEGDDQTLRLAFSQQLVDDDANNPMDLVVGDVNGADFRVRVNGTSTSLATWLASLDVANGVNTVTVAGDNNEILEIEFNNPLTSDEVEDFLDEESLIWIAPGNDIDGVAGQTGVTLQSEAVGIGRAENLTFTAAQLLQGSGQAGFGNGATEIWVAVDFSDTVTDPGDGNQFELLDADGNVIATSNTVQLALPTDAEVLGIDDANLDGTANDDVIDEAGTRLFVEFTLVDGDDAINSDATWSDDGQFDIDNRDTRSAISIRLADGFGGNVASNALGGVLAEDTTATLTDLARPAAIAFETRAGDTGDFGEFVDSVALVFDETVATNANTATRIFLGYNSGATISDLTTGLGAGLSIPTIDIVTTATVNDRELTATSIATTTTFVANDTISLGAPEVPVDGTANDGGTEILSGTGDQAYIGAFEDGAFADAGGRLAFGFGTFTGAGALTGGFEVVSDGAAPVLLGANSNDDLDFILAGFSEDVTNVLATEEAESFFVIMENDAVGRRVNISGGEVDFNGDNTVDIFLFDDELDEDLALDPGYNLSVFNPGHPVVDAAGNRVDPLVARERLVLITPPAAEILENGVAIIDESEKVVEIRLQVSGPVDINEDGDIAELAQRFFLRGDDFGGPGGNDGEALELGDLIEDIEFSSTANSAGNYTITLILAEGITFPQEDFYVEYADSDDLEEPADSYLVTPTDGGEIELSSEVVFVTVIRPPSSDNPSGNPLTMTIVGTLDLGDDTNALGARVTAWVWDANAGLGTMSFTYKGVVHTTTIDGVRNGEIRYFHPQLLGDGLGAVEPMGIVNRKPELDITATVNLTREGTENGNITEIEQETLVYQGLNNLGVTSIIRPIQLTFRTDPTCPGRFTVAGAGITNGAVVYSGEFNFIGEGVVTGNVIGGDADDEFGPRPYTIHTYGYRDPTTGSTYEGKPVVIAVEPEEFFAPDTDCFLANNLLFPIASSPNARALTFQSDINRTGANALPVVFNIDADNVTAFDLADYEQDNWAILPIATNQGDAGATGNLPNRVMSGNTVATAQANIPTNISARGTFVALDVDFCEPVMLDVDLVLALDNRGVFLGDPCNLNRVSAGHSYAIFSDDLDNGDYFWYTFGPRFASGSTLAVTSNNSNGGWNLLANLRNTAVAPGSFGGQVNITMDNEMGVRVWANGFTATNDLDEIGVNEGVLVHSTGNFNSTP